MKTRILSIAIAAVMIVGLASNADGAKGKSLKLASSLENVMDPSLDLESWMTNDLVWNQGDFANYTAASDESLELEAWMTNTVSWEYYPAATEASLEVESWMTNSMMWQMMPVEKDEQLVLEHWMTCDEIWNCPGISSPVFTGAESAYSAYLSENNK